MKHDDQIRILHMLDAAREALSFVGEVEHDAFVRNRLVVLAVIKELEIIGEAASKVSIATRDTHAEIPWQDIVGMRNRLIHGYFDIDLERVWDTVTGDVPELVKLLEQALV
jgi:uncharacterized protein with HEPN domain